MMSHSDRPTRLIDYKSFSELFSSAGIEIDDKKYYLLSEYAEMLCEWNEKINLTAITDPEGITIKHFFDSIYPFVLIPPNDGAALIDVGTGAGFPSIPLKICRPDISITLLDSLNKRVNFLKAVSDALDLGAECIHGRAEENARFIKNGNQMRGSFDVAAARAVANLRELCEYCLPFVKLGGSFYALKGKDGISEAKGAENAVKQLGGRIKEIKSYSLPNGDERVLIVIKKVHQTPQKYPRNSGQIKKNPL